MSVTEYINDFKSFGLLLSKLYVSFITLFLLLLIRGEKLSGAVLIIVGLVFCNYFSIELTVAAPATFGLFNDDVVLFNVSFGTVDPPPKNVP